MVRMSQWQSQMINLGDRVTNPASVSSRIQIPLADESQLVRNPNRTSFPTDNL